MVGGREEKRGVDGLQKLGLKRCMMAKIIVLMHVRMLYQS